MRRYDLNEPVRARQGDSAPARNGSVWQGRGRADVRQCPIPIIGNFKLTFHHHQSWRRLPSWWNHGSAQFFQAHPVKLAAGRAYSAEEDRPGGPPVALINYQLLQRLLGGQHHAIGKSITLNDRTFTIIGVWPKDLDTLPGEMVWAPLDPWVHEFKMQDRRNQEGVFVLARSRPNASFSQMQAELDTDAPISIAIPGNEFRSGHNAYFTPGATNKPLPHGALASAWRGGRSLARTSRIFFPYGLQDGGGKLRSAWPSAQIARKRSGK